MGNRKTVDGVSDGTSARPMGGARTGPRSGQGPDALRIRDDLVHRAWATERSPLDLGCLASRVPTESRQVDDVARGRVPPTYEVVVRPAHCSRIRATESCRAVAGGGRRPSAIFTTTGCGGRGVAFGRPELFVDRGCTQDQRRLCDGGLEIRGRVWSRCLPTTQIGGPGDAVNVPGPGTEGGPSMREYRICVVRRSSIAAVEIVRGELVRLVRWAR